MKDPRIQAALQALYSESCDPEANGLVEAVNDLALERDRFAKALRQSLDAAAADDKQDGISADGQR